MRSNITLFLQVKAQVDTLYFWDGIRKIDLVLAFEDPSDNSEEEEEKVSMRNIFIRNLVSKLENFLCQRPRGIISQSVCQTVALFTLGVNTIDSKWQLQSDTPNCGGTILMASFTYLLCLKYNITFDKHLIMNVICFQYRPQCHA